MKSPDISIIMPAYNSERYIGASVWSCLTQRNLGDLTHEVIVINDGSVDGTREVLADIQRRAGSLAKQLRIYDQDNGGIPEATNRGIAMARGEFLVTVDNDDLLAPDALVLLTDSIRRRGSVMSIGQHAGFDSATGKRLFVTDKKNFKVIGNNANEERLLHANGLGHPKMVRTREAQMVGGFSPEAGFAADYDLVLKLLFPGEMREWSLVDQVLYHYRVHSSASVVNRSAIIAGAEFAVNASLKRLGVTGEAKVMGRDRTGRLSYAW